MRLRVTKEALQAALENPDILAPASVLALAQDLLEARDTLRFTLEVSRERFLNSDSLPDKTTFAHIVIRLEELL